MPRARCCWRPDRQPPAADGRGSPRRGAGARADPLLPDLRRLRSDRQKLGVIGSGGHGVAEAMFLRGYHRGHHPDRARQGARSRRRGPRALRGYGIAAVDGPCQAVAVHEDCIVVDTRRGQSPFDSVYPALGSDTHVELALQLGAELRGRRAGGRQPPAHLVPASTPPATSCSASTRSATPWAKAASPRPRSATIWRDEHAA